MTELEADQRARVAEIEGRLSAITPPPWLLAPELCGPGGQGVYEAETMGPICEVGDPYPRSSNRPQENMTFITHAPEDMRFLLDALAAADAVVTPSERAGTHD